MLKKATMTFLGCGSAFSYINGQNNVLLEICNHKNETERLAIDCGTQFPIMVKKVKKWHANYVYKIGHYLITHNHADHAGGLEMTAFCSRFMPDVKKPCLYSTCNVLNDLWDKTLRGGLESLNYGQMSIEEITTGISLDSYFDTHYLQDNQSFTINDVKIEPLTTIHVNNRLGQKPSCGALITVPLENQDLKILYTGDTQYCPRQLQDLYNKVDLIFHDCETAPYYSQVHAHYDDLKTLPNETKGKIWLMHYNDNPPQNAIKDGFLGFVKQGQKFIWRNNK